MTQVGSFLSMGWHATPEGRTHFQGLYENETKRRKQFGVLEKPSLPSEAEECTYKVFVSGKAGVGKTASVCHLAGVVPPKSYHSTLGIRTTNVFWPAKVCQQVILFKVQLWDAGDATLKKFAHVLTACKEKVDGVLLTFSFTDRSTFRDLVDEVKSISQWAEKPAIFAIGTRFGMAPDAEVCQGDVDSFEKQWSIPILKTNNRMVTGKADLEEVAPLLNTICERLWLREQELMISRQR